MHRRVPLGLIALLYGTNLLDLLVDGSLIHDCELWLLSPGLMEERETSRRHEEGTLVLGVSSLGLT